MSKKTYMLVGNWHYIPGPRGYTIYRYEPETAAMTLVEHAHEDVASGYQAVDEEKGIVYVANEIPDMHGKVGGGGYILAMKIDPETGCASVINEKRALCTSPSYVCLDASKKYLLAVPFGGFGHVTKIVKDDEERYITKTFFDDTAVLLYRINEDGSLGDICDLYMISGDPKPGPHTNPHLHSIVPDPTGELYIVCDRGMDKLYSFGIDRENGKLIFKSESTLETGSWPRYGLFHPALPLYYSNNEKTPDIFTFRYDVQNGHMKRIACTSIQPEENCGDPTEPSDIVIHPDSKCLYVSDRSANMIAVLDVGADGVLKLRGRVECGGQNPRGLCVSPDGRFLIVANTDSANIAVFAIEEDGWLKFVSNETKGVTPACIRFITL